MESGKRKLAKRIAVELDKALIIDRGDDVNEELCRAIEAEIVKEITKPYYYLDAVARKDQGHIGFCTYRN